MNQTTEDKIILCKDIECPLRSSCVRFLKNVEPMDTFFEESPRKGQECDLFVSWIKNLNVMPKKLKQQKSTVLIKKEWEKKKEVEKE